MDMNRKEYRHPTNLDTWMYKVESWNTLKENQEYMKIQYR